MSRSDRPRADEPAPALEDPDQAASAPVHTPDEAGAPTSTLRASGWTLAGYGGSQALRFVGNLILTRLLFPDVFGLAALVSIFIQGLWMFSDVGTGPAIIQSPHGDDPGFLNTCWTIQSVRGVTLWLISWAIAVPVATFYGQPLLAQLIPVAGFNAVLNGLEATSSSTCVRHLKVKNVIVVELIAQFVNITSIILLAMAYRAGHAADDMRVVWVVVAGNLLGNLSRLVLTHTYLEHIRHRFLLDRHWMRVQFNFGRWITFSTILTFLSNQSDRLLFGKLIPLQALGVYNIGSTLAVIPTQVLDTLGSRVLFPKYSRLAGQAGFGSTFLRMRLSLLMGGAILISGLLAAGPHFVRILYDHRYWDAGWILQFLSLAAWFQMLESANGAALLALGHTKWKAAAGAAKLVGMAAFTLAGFKLDGFRGALVGLVLSDVAKYVTSSVGVLRHGLRPLALDAGFTLAVLATAGIGYLCGNALTGGGGRDLVPFLASGTTVVILWAPAALWLLRRERARRVPAAAAGGQPSA